MTELQLKLLEYFKSYRLKYRTHPTLTEAARHFKTTRQNITLRAKSLVNKVYLEKLRAGVFIHTHKK